MVAAVAMLSPQTAPKAAQVPTVAMARPPLKCPTHLLKVPKAFPVIPARPAMMPIRTKRGITTRYWELPTRHTVVARVFSAAGMPLREPDAYEPGYHQ